MFAPASPGAPLLGIDPGLTRCGYGAVVREGSRWRATAAGVIRTDPALEIPIRLARLADELEALLDDLRPATVVVERVLFQANVRTAISVGQASGLALTAAARRGIPVVQYSPNEVKQAVTGDGAADKAAVQRMVAHLLALRAAPEPPDVADALALALCHGWRDRTAGAVAAAGPGGADRLAARIEAALAKQGGARR